MPKKKPPIEPHIISETKKATPLPNDTADEIARLLFDNMTVGQLEKILEAQENGQAEAAYLATIAELAQVAQEDTSGGADPGPANLDIENIKKVIAEAGGFAVIADRIKARFEGLAQQTADTMLNSIEETSKSIDEAIIRSTIQAIIEAAADVLPLLDDILLKDDARQMLTDLISSRNEIAELAKGGEELKQLLPFLKAELEAAKEDPDFTDCTLTDLVADGFDEHGKPTDSKFRSLIDRAMQKRNTIYRPKAKAPTKHDILLDKVNNEIWNYFEEAARGQNGQLWFSKDIDTSKKDSEQEAIIYYGINFDELDPEIKITRQLTPFDKRCYTAIGALFNAGNETISATQIYYTMGNTTRPNATDLKKVNDSLTKMAAARVFINNKKEVEAAKKEQEEKGKKAPKGYPPFKYDASLLPFERISAYINDQLTESAIHLFREPPLISFAKGRKQFTTVEQKLLQSGMPKTDANLRIEDYLLERISYMRRPKNPAPNKLLFDTLFEHCGIKEKKQKQRAPGKITEYLEHYKACGWIKGYKMVKDEGKSPIGVNIYL